MGRDIAAHVSTSLTKASTETDGAISTTWVEDVAMSVWQRKTKEIYGEFPLIHKTMKKIMFNDKIGLAQAGIKQQED